MSHEYTNRIENHETGLHSNPNNIVNSIGQIRHNQIKLTHRRDVDEAARGSVRHRRYERTNQR